MVTARSVSVSGIIDLSAMDAHTGGKLPSGLADVIFATVVTSNTAQKIFGFTRHIFISIKRLATLNEIEVPIFRLGHVPHLDSLHLETAYFSGVNLNLALVNIFFALSGRLWLWSWSNVLISCGSS